MARVAVGDLFERDPVTKMMIPRITEGYGWVKDGTNSGQVLVTIRIEGIEVEYRKTGALKDLWRKEVVAGVPASVRCERWRTEDKILFDALENEAWEGHYIVYGPGILNNPLRAEDLMAVRIFPVANDLILYSGKHKIQRGRNVKVQEFYDSIYKELSESPDIPGLVFHWEETGMRTRSAAQVKRLDFGLEWPVKQPDPEPPLPQLTVAEGD